MSTLINEVAVRKNSGANLGIRRRLNFIEGPNVTLTLTDDPINQEIDIEVEVIPSILVGGIAPITYTVYKSGGIYYAVHGLTGVTVNNASFSTLMSVLSGHIYLMTGTYTVDATINLNNPYTILEGAGWGTLLTLDNGVDDNVIIITAGNCFLRNFRIYGNDGNNTGTSHGIYVYRSAGHRIENLKISDCNSDGIHLGETTWQACLGGKITGCYIGPNTSNGIYVDYSATDWEICINVLASHSNANKAGMVIDGSNLFTSGNHYWGNYYNLVVAPLHHVAGPVSVGDKYMDNLHHGIYKPGTGSNWQWHNANFTGCYFWRNGETAVDTYDSIFTVDPVRCIVFSGCTFRGENDAGTHETKYVWNADADVDYSMITGCTVEGYHEVDPIVFAGTGCVEAHNVEYDNS